MFDYVFKDARIVDGQKTAPFISDLAIAGDKIAAVGKLDHAPSKFTIRADNRVLAPGFIDFHSHADFSLPACPTADSLVHQGVTSAVIGQCGETMAPLFEETRKSVIPFLANRRPHIPFEKWSDFETYLNFYEDLSPSINTLFLIGQGTLRAGVAGFGAAKPTAQQLGKMKRAVSQAMDAGAFGVSTGLIYPPGSYADTDELIEITKPVGERNGIYFSHIRNERDGLLRAMEEAVAIGRASGARVQISHLKACWPKNWDKQGPALELMEKAIASGVDVGADAYPYTASSMGLVSLLPARSQEGGPKKILQRLADSGERRKIKVFMEKEGFLKYGAWENVMISYFPGQEELAGRFVHELALDAKADPTDWVFDALLKAELGITQVSFVVSEDNLQKVLLNPLVVIGSDAAAIPSTGPLAAGCPHPRTFGPFPRILGRYVRELKLLPLEEAVYKMTGQPAFRLGLADRGVIKPGFKADLVLFDPEKIKDTATFTNPCQYPTGIHWVFTNGVPVLENRKTTGKRAGRVLRRK